LILSLPPRPSIRSADGPPRRKSERGDPSIRAAIALAVKRRRAAAVTRTTGRPIDDLDALPGRRLFSAG
jgi:hypothetical protein